MKIKSYLHLYTEDVSLSKAFYKNIGLKILDDYSNEEGFCLQLSTTSFVMILEKSHFQSFHKNLILSHRDQHNSFLSLQLSSKKQVDSLMKKVIKHGGFETDQAVENDHLYYRSFKDIDSHQFEVFVYNKIE
jgi:predicted lactoylglutathione lyase